MSREQEVDVLMREIRALGIELSIDDFGTGYSSLAYLKRFPVQRLKVDRAFIRDLGKDEDSAAIVRSIVNLAHGLKLGVVAEGRRNRAAAGDPARDGVRRVPGLPVQPPGRRRRGAGAVRAERAGLTAPLPSTRRAAIMVSFQ